MTRRRPKTCKYHYFAGDNQPHRSTACGFFTDDYIAIGIVGAFIGDWLLPQIGIHLGTGIVSAIVNATIGAVLLLLWSGFYKGVAVLEAGGDADGGSRRARRRAN